MKFDDILEKIGEFGRYQKRLYLQLCLTAIVCGIQAYIPVIHVATPDFRCALANYPNDTYEIQSPRHATLVNRSIPLVYADFRYRYDKCRMRAESVVEANGHNETADSRNETTYSDVAGYSNTTRYSNTTVECDDWVYDRKSGMRVSVVTQMDIVCNNRVQRSHTKMAFLAGKLVGSMVLGAAADLAGRKKMLLVSAFIQFSVGLANAFVTDYIWFSVCRFFIGAASSGLFISAFVMGMELVGKSKRMWVGLVIELFFPLGGVIVAGLGYVIRDWRIVQIAVSIPSLFFMVYYWVLPESSRWLISRGRVQEATVVLERIARSNHTILPDNLELIDETKDIQTAKLWQLCSTRTLVVRTAIVFFNWAVVSGVYYGLTLNSEKLHDNMFLGLFLSAVVEFPAIILCMLLIDRVGRKGLHTSMMLVGGAANLCTIFTVLYGNADVQWTTIVLALVGKMAAAGAFAIIYLFTSELFPTVLRNGAVGACSTVSRIGGMLSPYIADLGQLVTTDFGKALPLVIFGGMSVAAGLLALFLPETLRQPLPETVQDANNMGKPGWNMKAKVDINGDDNNAVVCQPMKENVELNNYTSKPA